LAKEIDRANRRQQKASQRAYAIAHREAESARKREKQAYARALKATAAELKRLEKEARECHLAAMAAEVECRNLGIAEMEEELQGILAATLDVDDHVDLNTLKVRAEHPPFPRPDLLKPSRPPLPIGDAPQPVYVEPPAPGRLLSFLTKKLHGKKVAASLVKHQKEMAKWQEDVQQNERLRAAEATAYEERDYIRRTTLAAEQACYQEDCAEREREAQVRNREVDELITNLAYGITEAIEEYIGIVLSNAVYPEHFPISHDHAFDPSVAELKLAVAVVPPARFPAVKGYKYVKASDEITPVAFSAKACKDRYADAVQQVALRVPHEIFEADRRGLIRTISLTVGTHGSDPATGRSSFIPLVAMGVGRDAFMKIKLSDIQPAATLAYLGASISKNPHGLVPANISGVRKS